MFREILVAFLVATSISGGVRAANPQRETKADAQEERRAPRAHRVERASDLPFAVRCDLVRTLFSEQAFNELYGYLDSGCAGRTRMGGRARVLARVDDDIWYGDTGTGPPDELLFSEAEHCEGARFVVLPDAKSLTSNQAFIDVSVKPKTKGSYSFFVGVAVPNGTAGCLGVRGRAALKGRKWTVSPG